MLSIRLQRVGRKHEPTFRVVLTDSKNGPKSGKFLEILGAYDARKGAPQLNGERIVYWMSKGAQTSETLHNLLVKARILRSRKADTTKNIRAAKALKKAEAPVA